MIIVLFGKPGAGKGTQAPLLAAALGVPTLATGDELRAAIRAGTPLGLEAKGYMDRGDLVPDAVILGIIKQALTEPRTAGGVLLDGVVRTVPQAEGLAKVCEELGTRVDAVLCFDIDDEEIVRRLAGRTTCETCQTPYSGREPGSKCDKDGGTLVRRKDDEPAAIRKRLEVYRTQTAPVLQWYRAHGTKVSTIDAVGSVQDVTARALGALAS
jgi:adenylate kinase